MRLLVADDDPLVPRITAKALGRRDWDVVTAATASEALSAAETESLDAVTLDLHLPGGDDLALLGRIREVVDVPVVVVSGDVEVGEQATAAGAHAFLAKPVDLEELYRVLCEAVGVEYDGPLGIG